MKRWLGIALVEQFAARKFDHLDAPEATLRIARGEDFVDALIERGLPARMLGELAAGERTVIGLCAKRERLRGSRDAACARSSEIRR